MLPMENENGSSAKFLSSPALRSLGGSPTYRRNPRETQKYYKPTSTRLPFLLGVLFIALALIAVVEVACHRLPIEDNSSLLGLNLTRRAPPHGAQDENPNSASFRPFEDIAIRNPSEVAGTQSSAVAQLPPTGSIPAASPVSSAPKPSQDIPTTIPTPVIRPSAAETAYIPTYSSAAPSGYIPDPKSRTVTIIMALTHVSAYVPTVTAPDPETHLQTLTITPGAYIPTDPPSTPATTGPGGIGTESELPTRTTIPDAYIPTTSPSPPANSAPPPGGATTTDSGGHVVTIQPVTASNGAYIPTGAATVQGQPQTGNSPPPSGNSDNGKATSLVPVATYTTDGFVVVEMGTTTTPVYVPISTYTTSGYAMVVMGTQPPTSLVPVSTVTSDGVAVVILGRPTSTPTGTALAQSGDVVVVTPITTTSSDGKVYTYMTTMTVHGTKATGTAAAATATGAATNQKSSCSATSAEAVTSHEFTPMNYFTAAYLPTLGAVAFRILWTLVYNNARLMEPFYRLTSPAGASGKNCLEILYLSMDDFIPEPFPSLLTGHSYMLVVSSIAALTQLLAPLCAEFLAVDMTHGVIYGDGQDPNHPCLPQMMVRYLPARILQGILGAIAVAIILTIILGWNRPSGVYSDPSSIAAMASLLHHPDVVDQFKALGPHASYEETARIAGEQVYKLGYYQTGEGMKYGVIPVLSLSTLQARRTSNTYTPVLNPGSGAVSPKFGLQFWRHTWRTVGDIVLGVLLLGVLGVVVAYYKDADDDGFNRFFNSQSFGPKFILVLASGVIVSQWKRIEREVRTTQPYRQLASHSASSPKHTILQVMTATPLTTIPLALVQREFFTALVSFCYLLSEVLVIVVATVPFSVAEYWVAYLSGTYLCFSILGLQILTFVTMIIWWRRTGPHLERDPDTTLGVWTLLAHSGLREDLEDLGTAGRKDLVESVKGWRKRYWMGEVMGNDGLMHMGIYDDLVMFGVDNDGYDRSKVRLGGDSPGGDQSSFSPSETSSLRHELV